MQLKVMTIAIATWGLLWLGACSSTQTATTPSSSTPASGNPSATTSSPTASPDQTTAVKPGAHGGQGGQVIEAGPYHLELLTFKEADNTHIDFFFQKGDNHEPIPNAKVTAQVQLPDGSQQSLDMKYDDNGKHYVAILPTAAPGEYKIAILTDIDGEKVNGRFSFKQ